MKPTPTPTVRANSSPCKVSDAAKAVIMIPAETAMIDANSQTYRIRIGTGRRMRCGAAGAVATAAPPWAGGHAIVGASPVPAMAAFHAADQLGCGEPAGA